MTFSEWMKRVDAVLVRICGMGSDDLPDVDYWELFDNDSDPAYAALHALEAAGYGA